MPPPMAALAALGEEMTKLKQSIQQVKGKFDQLSNTMKSFVQAFSPSAVLMFDHAMRDLSAVIGSAILPMFNLLTQALRGVASILLPTFQALQPVIQRVTEVFRSLLAGGLDQFELLMAPVLQLAKLFATLAEMLLPLLKVCQQVTAALTGLLGGVLSLVIGILGSLLEAIQPLIDIFAGIVGVIVTMTKAVFSWAEGLVRAMLVLNPVILALQWLGSALQVYADLFGLLNPILSALNVIMAGVLNVFRSLVVSLTGNLFGDTMENLAGAFRKVATYAILAAAALARLLGVTSFIEGMKKALGGDRKSAVGFAAPQEARTGSDIMAWARSFSEQAMLAGPGGAEAGRDAEQVWREGTLAALTNLPSREELKQMLIDAAMSVVNGIVAGLKEQTYKGGSTLAGRAAVVALNPLGTAVAVAKSFGGGTGG